MERPAKFSRNKATRRLTAQRKVILRTCRHIPKRRFVIFKDEQSSGRAGLTQMKNDYCDLPRPTKKASYADWPSEIS